MNYKQARPMQWITFYYYGNDPEKIKKAKNEKRQMLRKIRYANVIEEIRDEQLEILSDTEKHFAGMTPNGLIVMFENNY
ncbi:hypothetical protein [Oceanobacillus sp. FSL H7-0719]|uniref:hypothetical protein n=1 Tax=Oceanobacillus sp. FSL H7-0719 TaxID=2954507 RepID=UPI0032446168